MGLSLRTDSYYVLCVVEGLDNLRNLLSLLEPHRKLFLWKTHQLKMAQQFMRLISLDSRNLLPLSPLGGERRLKYLLIQTIYSIANNRNFSKEYWFKRIDDIFNKKSVSGEENIFPWGEFYITPVMDKVNKTGKIASWCVYLPKFCNPNPRSKYFSFEKYGGQDIALKEAIAYRDAVINKWFTDNGYVVDL